MPTFCRYFVISGNTSLFYGQTFRLKEKFFVSKNIFKQVMADSGLNLSFTVENKLTGDGEMRVEIPARSMDSLKPERAVAAVFMFTEISTHCLAAYCIFPYYQ